MTHEQTAALDALADTAGIERARAALTDTDAKLTAAERAEPEARAAVADANAARAALVAGAASGQPATPKAIAAAARAVQDAENHLAFIRDLAGQLRAERQQREADLMRAQAQAYRPVALHGVRLRLAALPRIAAAAAALAEARRDFARGTAALVHAEARGFAPRPSWAPGSFGTGQPDPYAERPEAAELAYWRSAGLDIAETTDTAKAA